MPSSEVPLILQFTTRLYRHEHVNEAGESYMHSSLQQSMRSHTSAGTASSRMLFLVKLLLISCTLAVYVCPGTKSLNTTS